MTGKETQNDKGGVLLWRVRREDSSAAPLNDKGEVLGMTGGGVFMTLAEKALAYNREIKEALETVYGALNEGQKKKILKNAKVKALFDRYKINCKGGV